MFTITDIAADKAKEILAAEGKAEWGLRIFVAGGGCCGPSYGMDLDEVAKDGDKVYEHNGLKVFADTEAAEKLVGMTMDFIDDGQNQGFIIKADNPGPSACGPGCGSGCGS
jgi:iron-sulfur cluster assembly accessory protein